MLKVVMDAQQKTTGVNSDDMHTLPRFKIPGKKQIELIGKYSGTVTKFTVNDLFIRQ